jgi:hypothetical protein
MKLFRSIKKRFRKRDIQSLCFIAGVIGIVSIKSLMACGDFRMPSNHFEGVSSQGYVSIWKQLDTLDLGDASVPILLGAQTYREIPSGELGAGWIMPLFDSGIVQRDENTFDMITPDGTMDFFSRDGSDPNILHGSSGWTAEIQGSDIIVHSKCGSGWKMVFRQGKLNSLSKGSHKLGIQRDQLNRPTGITENGISRLALNRDEKTGLMSSLEMNGKKYLLGYDGKPRLENVGGQNLVGGVDSSLHEISRPDGKKETYDFAVTDKMLPNLKITDTTGKERMIVWGLDGKILQDGEGSYKITPSRDAGANAAIERTNQQNQKEYWFKDDPNGMETTVALDGIKTERSWFTSGPAHGKTRKVEQVDGGIKKVLEQSSYDEKGLIIRKIDSKGGITLFKYNQNGERIYATPEELRRKEQTLLSLISNKNEDGDKERNIYNLAMFYIHQIPELEKARNLSGMINNSKKRFAIVLQSYDYDRSLSEQTKIIKFKTLAQKFPEEENFINELIKARKSTDS